MDSELQTALDKLVDTNAKWDPIVEAARKVANPDYEAAAKVDGEWLGTNDPRGRILRVRATVNAALGLGGS